MASYSYRNYDRYLKEIDDNLALTSKILIGAIVIILLVVLVRFVQANRGECLIQLSDGTKVEAKGCMSWSRTNTLDCDDGKTYSLFAIQSWECK
jgi:hypothetical protein